jgi:hypothetical protein
VFYSSHNQLPLRQYKPDTKIKQSDNFTWWAKWIYKMCGELCNYVPTHLCVEVWWRELIEVCSTEIWLPANTFVYFYLLFNTKNIHVMKQLNFLLVKWLRVYSLLISASRAMFV